MNKLFLLAALSFGCQSPFAPTMSQPRSFAHDAHSFAEPNRVSVRHVDLDLTLDFDRRVAHGTVRLELERRDPAAPLTLDTRALSIQRVSSQGVERSFRFGEASEELGTPLVIDLGPDDRDVLIEYETGPGAEALQWLAPEQTAGGAHPFLFTQGQSILTRTWIPLQDSPGVRVSYAARVRAPAALTVVMSAEQREPDDDDGAFRFALERPIPPYLIALACGELASKDISDRCAIWAEPSMLDSSHAEFAETEEMIRTAEDLFGPYRWGRYDMIVLPPAFPFGGMENPLLTFLTPTVIAGDRSLTSLVAHELAHSWSGNLVTNATWRDFWLNEGTTVYFEQRIVEEVYGVERARMERKLALDELRKTVAGMQPWETVLHVELEGKHPDAGFSSIPYDKGALFLLRCEQAVGREAFDRFLRSWFDDHAFESVTTADFHTYLHERLIAQEPAMSQIDVDHWLFGTGLPDDVPTASSDAFERVEAELARWTNGTAAQDLATSAWVTQQWLHFLASVPADMTNEQMSELDSAFGLTASGNSEILCKWLELSIREGYRPADARLEEFLMNVGRRKFLQPLYEALVKTEAGAERARRIYQTARPRYHAVSSGTLDDIVLDAK